MFEKVDFTALKTAEVMRWCNFHGNSTARLGWDILNGSSFFLNSQ